MSEQNADQKLDDALAAFTDQVLAGEQEDSSTDMLDNELSDTILRIHRALGPPEVDEQMKQRVHHVAMMEWREERRKKKQTASPFDWLQQLMPSSGQLPVWAGAVAAVIVLVAVFVLLPLDGGSISGAAGSPDGGLVAAAVVAGAALGGILFWWLGRRG